MRWRPEASISAQAHAAHTGKVESALLGRPSGPIEQTGIPGPG